MRTPKLGNRHDSNIPNSQNNLPNWKWTLIIGGFGGIGVLILAIIFLKFSPECSPVTVQIKPVYGEIVLQKGGCEADK